MASALPLHPNVVHTNDVRRLSGGKARAAIGSAITRGIGLLIVTMAVGAARLHAQSVVVTANVNVRGNHAKASAVVGHLARGDTVTLADSVKSSGYFQIRRADNSVGWVYGEYLRAFVAGTPTTRGCGDGLWHHIYHPDRLLVLRDCVTVTGTVVDATDGKNRDGARHEADGDTHSWIALDPQYVDMVDGGDKTHEQGNLVFEIVCHYGVTQADAKSACAGFRDRISIPAIGTHVSITGTYVHDHQHGWNEIHPVSTISMKP